MWICSGGMEINFGDGAICGASGPDWHVTYSRACSSKYTAMSAANLTEFFDEIIKLLQETDRQYGIANSSYTDYALERLEHCILTCTHIRERLEVEPQPSQDIQEYCTMLNSLIECLRRVYNKWEEYDDILNSYPERYSYHVPVVHGGNRVGRPRFQISRDQLLYLISLSFKWTEVSALLGVSRMTVYRLVV